MNTIKIFLIFLISLVLIGSINTKFKEKNSSLNLSKGSRIVSDKEKLNSTIYFITKYNRYVESKEFDKAYDLAFNNFPISELERIEKEGHSIIKKIDNFTFDREKSNLEYKKVTQVYTNETDEIYQIFYENDTLIETTWSHPFYILNKGWVEVKDLQVGDISKTSDGKLKIIDIKINKLDKPIKVYNLEVEGNHNYFVSNSGILVHNQNRVIYGNNIRSEYLTGGGGGNRGISTVKQGVRVPSKTSIRNSSSKSNWGSEKTLERHFKDHGKDFNANSPSDYAQKASAFLRESQINKYPTKIDRGGIIKVYDPKTNTFGSYNSNGSTKTFFKPDPAKHKMINNLEYWKSQSGKEL